MRRIIALALIVIMLFSSFGVYAGELQPGDAAKSGTCGDDITWELSDAGVLTISGSGSMTDYDQQYNTPWYESRDEIKSVVFSGNITSVGNNAFGCCENLEKVTFPESLESIGSSAFDPCFELKSAELPEGLKKIDVFAFQHTALTSAKLPEGLTYLGGSSFSHTKIRTITLPAQVTCLESFARGCKDLYKIKVSSENTRIDSRNNCNAVIAKDFWVEEKDDLTAEVHSGGDSLTQGCRNTVIPPDVYAIGSGAFSYLDIEDIFIPEGVHYIAETAFLGCDRLKTVTIPSTVEKIGRDAFNDCNSITDIYFGGTKEQWDAINISKREGDEAAFFKATVHYGADATYKGGNEEEEEWEEKDDEEETGLVGCGGFKMGVDTFGVDDPNNKTGDYWNYSMCDQLDVGLFEWIKLELCRAANSSSGGWCYGAAAVMGLIYLNVYPVSQFGAERTIDIKHGDKIDSLVTYYFMMQFLDSVRSISGKLSYGSLGEKLIKTLEKRNPCVLSFTTNEGTSHGVLAYAFDRESDPEYYLVHIADPSGLRVPTDNGYIPNTEPGILRIRKSDYEWKINGKAYYSSYNGQNPLVKLDRVIGVRDLFDNGAEIEKQVGITTNILTFDVTTSDDGLVTVSEPYYTDRGDTVSSDLITYYVEDGYEKGDGLKIRNTSGEKGIVSIGFAEENVGCFAKTDAEVLEFSEDGTVSVSGAGGESTLGFTLETPYGEKEGVIVSIKAEAADISAGTEDGVLKIAANKKLDDIEISIDGETRKINADSNTYELELGEEIEGLKKKEEPPKEIEEKKEDEKGDKKEEVKTARKLTLAKGETMIVGEKATLEIAGVDNQAVFAKGKAGTYSGGEIAATKKGTLKLMCLIDGKKKTVCTIKVEQPKLKPKLKLKAGASKQLKLTGTKRTAEKWESSDPEIATVSATGAVTGVKAGSVTVTAYIGDQKYTSSVLVK